MTGTADLDPASRLFTDTVVPPLILTVESAPAPRRAALTEAGGEVVALPRLTPDLVLPGSSPGAACDRSCARAGRRCSGRCTPPTPWTSCA